MEVPLIHINFVLPLIIHSMARPSLLLQKTTLSPWTTLNESNLLHWTRNFVKRLWGPTISGSASLTRILRGPEKKEEKMDLSIKKRREFHVANFTLMTNKKQISFYV